MIEHETTTQSRDAARPPSQGHSKITLAIVLILGIAVGIVLVVAIESWRSSDDNSDNLVPVTTVEDARKIMRIMDAIEDNDDVQDVYSNFDIPDDVMEAAAG